MSDNCRHLQHRPTGEDLDMQYLVSRLYINFARLLKVNDQIIPVCSLDPKSSDLCIPMEQNYNDV